MCHFGRFLAYFGVVYIRDFDRKLIITFSNYDSSYASIKKSSFYKEIEKSEYYNLYEEKLNELDEKYQKIKQEIDKLKKDPFSVKSYWVFICTKISVRTRNNPKLKGYTNDSKKAKNLYDGLKNKKFEVFYGEETLSGIEYDAQIFSALLNSQVMVVIATEKEYLESSWVRSEWKKWLYLIKKGYKNQNSLKLYISKGNYFELPYKLHKFEIIDNPLQVIRSFEDSMN